MNALNPPLADTDVAPRPHTTSTPQPAAARGGGNGAFPRPAPSRAHGALRALGTWIFAGAGAVLIYALRPGALTDDTYAFLDWGRDLRHGFLPLLEHRTFQPLPVGAGALLSLLGSAAPTATVILSLAAELLLAVAVWRVVALLGFGPVAGALGAALVLFNRVLPVLALVGYNNLPFATLMIWALVYELEDRPTGVWVLLALAGLTRPEGWAFLLAYGALRWWRAGRPLAPGRWLGTLALAIWPLLLWVGMEWVFFGSPLYSLHATAGPAVHHTTSGSLQGLWNSLDGSAEVPVLIAAGVGALAIAAWTSLRAAVTVLGMTVVAALSVLVLAGSNFNVPSRDFSVLVAMLIVLAAAGVTVPARAVRRLAPATPSWLSGMIGLAGAALIVWGISTPVLAGFHHESLTVGANHTTGLQLRAATQRALREVDRRGARQGTVALYGAVIDSELIWDLGVPYNVVSDGTAPQSRVIVQPSYATFSWLTALNLDGRLRWTPLRGWQRVVDGPWQIFLHGRRRPVRLG